MNAPELVKYYAAKFREVHGVPASDFSIPRDAAIIKRLLHGFDDAQIRFGIDAMLEDRDPFLRQNSWSLRMLPRRLSGYLTKPWWEYHLDGKPFKRDGKKVRIQRRYGETWLEEWGQAGEFEGRVWKWKKRERLA